VLERNGNHEIGIVCAERVESDRTVVKMSKSGSREVRWSHREEREQDGALRLLPVDNRQQSFRRSCFAGVSVRFSTSQLWSSKWRGRWG
jgi:hypothetical protein